jgi:hypothetical protein
MQRWIVAGLVALALALGAGAFAYYQYKMGLPAPVWVPLPVNATLPGERHEAAARELRAKLCEGELLLKVARDLGLAKTWKLGSDEEAAAELERRLFVRTGEADMPNGRVPAIHVGIEGSRREFEMSGRIVTRLRSDVWGIIGQKPPPE